MHFALSLCLIVAVASARDLVSGVTFELTPSNDLTQPILDPLSSQDWWTIRAYVGERGTEQTPVDLVVDSLSNFTAIKIQASNSTGDSSLSYNFQKRWTMQGSVTQETVCFRNLRSNTIDVCGDSAQFIAFDEVIYQNNSVGPRIDGVLSLA